MVKVPREEMSSAPSFMPSGSFIRLWVGAMLVCSISLPVSVRSTGAMAEPMNTNRNIPTSTIAITPPVIYFKAKAMLPPAASPQRAEASEGRYCDTPYIDTNTATSPAVDNHLFISLIFSMTAASARPATCGARRAAIARDRQKSNKDMQFSTTRLDYPIKITKFARIID